VEYVRNVRGTCKDAGAYAEHMWNMHGICLESIRNLYEYVWNMQGICDVRNMYGVRAEYAWSMRGTNMLGNILDVWNMHEGCVD